MVLFALAWKVTPFFRPAQPALPSVQMPVDSAMAESGSSSKTPQSDIEAPISPLAALKTMVRVPSEPMPQGALGLGHGKPWRDIPEWKKLSPAERLVRLIQQPFGLEDGGQVKVLELAKDELYLTAEPDPRKRVIKIPPHVEAAALLDKAKSLARPGEKQPQLVFYPVGTKPEERTEWNRRILSDQVVMEVNDAPTAITTATEQGIQAVRVVTASPGYVAGLDNRFPGAALVAAADLDHQPSIASSRPMLAAARAKKYTPTDPLFKNQWHLSNSGSIHINPRSAWDTYRGAGITVAVVDDGVQLTHPDLAANMDSRSLHYDYNDNDTNPAPFTQGANTLHDRHGTACAGLLAADNNSVGGVGVAPDVSLVGIRLIAAPATSLDEANALGSDTDLIQLKSNSWGPPDEPNVIGSMDSLVANALRNAAVNGRNGKGTIYTFAGGNGREDGDQSNKDAYANNIHTIGVAALSSTGAAASYSEYGPNILVSAPADRVTTTDLIGSAGYKTNSDYTTDFGGTSAATPIVSGVIALMLQANPELGWRDVKEILLRSSRRVNSTDTAWISRAGGKYNIAPIKHNSKYGGGMVDAGAAVTMAKSWANLGLMSSLVVTDQNSAKIPDNNTTGITRNFDFSTQDPVRVEMVEVRLNATHEYRGDLEVRLTSPSGVISTLVTSTPADDSDKGYFNWTFSSNRFWGDSSVGVWKLNVRDLASPDVGNYLNATVRLHGVVTTPAELTTTHESHYFKLSGETVDLTAEGAGDGEILYTWKKSTTIVKSDTTGVYNIPRVSSTHAGNYTLTASNVTGQDTTNFGISIITPPPAAPIFSEGTDIILTVGSVLAAGKVATYQWRKNEINLVNDDPSLPTARVLGATSPKLVIRQSRDGDQGTYSCLVTIDGETRLLPESLVALRFKPQIQLTELPTDWIVSGAVAPLNLNILNEVTKVTITGLPAGLSYNTRTGEIFGTPSASVVNKLITIKVTNAAGSTTRTFLLNVAALDEQNYGNFSATIARNADPAANSNYGGRIYSLVIGRNGYFTGSLQMGSATAFPFKGRLAASANADSTTTVTIKRKLPLSALTLNFSISRETGEIIGNIYDATATWNANVTGQRATPSLTRAARHNFFLTAQEPSLNAETVPLGSGAGYVTYSAKTGNVTVALRLADGSVVSRNSVCGATGKVPLFYMLYGNRGSLLGNLTLTDNLSPALDTVSADLSWNKTGPSSSKDKLYPAGFDFGVSNTNLLLAEGSEYNKPIKPTILWGLPTVAVDQTQVQLFFNGANLETSAYYIADPNVFNLSLRIDDNHKVYLPALNTAKVTVKLNSSTGEVSGTLTLKDGLPVVTRTLSYYGIISLQHQRAKGYFILPQLPTSSTQAGQWQLLPHIMGEN